MICINKKCGRELDDNFLYCPYCGRKQVRETKKGKKVRGNGQGTAYKLPNGSYRAVVTLGYIDGKRIQKTKSGFKTKKDALEYIPILRKDIQEKKHINFSEAFEMWKDSHYRTIGKSKQSSYNTAYKRCKPLYFRDVATIKLFDMQELVDQCPGGYYPKQDIKVLLNHVLRYAKINEYCTTNFAEYIKLPPLEKSKKVSFNQEELNALWTDYNNGNEFTGYILIMIYTGMRYGEISTILKENINLTDHYMIGGIKTDAGKNRQIPIADKIFPIVERFYSNNDTKLLEMSEKIFYDNFKDTIARIGARTILTPHCCRHTFSTMMAENNIQPAIIKETAGHANYSTTLGYTHIPLQSKLDAVNKL